MTKKDYSVLAALVALALFIWLRDTSWMSSAEDTLPILIALPVFYWLGKPWKFITQEQPLELQGWRLGLVAVLFII